MISPETSTFAAMLQQCRNDAGLSQEELAARAGVSPRAVSYLETGRVRRPRRDTVTALAVALGLDDMTRALFLARARAREVDRVAGQRGWVSRWQLPPDVPDFTGRADAVRNLKEALWAGGPTIVVITGLAGVGKSALATHLGHATAKRFPGGQLYVDLRGSTDHPADPLMVQARFLRSLGVDASSVPADPDERGAMYRSELGRQRTLLLVDDARDEAQVRPLLPGRVDCAVLVTARPTLSALAGVRLVHLEALAPDEALTLLARVGGADRVATETAAAENVVRACGFLPLAVRIAGARLASRPRWSVASLAARLAAEHERMAELRVGDVGVEASFSLSYDQLDPAQARALRLLALPEVHDVSEAAAAAVLGIARPAAVQVLQSLTDVGLLTSVTPERYRYHELLRLFARLRSRTQDGAPDRAEAFAGLLAHYLATMRNAWALVSPAETTPQRLEGPSGPGLAFPTRDSVTNWGYAERPDILAVLRQAVDETGVPIGLTANVLYGVSIFAALGHGLAAAEDAARAVTDEAHRRGDDRAETIGRLQLAHALYEGNQTDRAATELRRADELCEALGDDAIYAEVLNLCGHLAFRERDLEAARRHFSKACDIQRRIGDRIGETTIKGSLARIDIELGRADLALPVLSGNVDVFRQVGDVAGEIATQYHLGVAFLRLGRADEALATFTECLQCSEAQRHPYRMGALLRRIMELNLATQQYAAAVAYAERAVEFFRDRREPDRAKEVLTALERGMEGVHRTGATAAPTGPA